MAWGNAGSETLTSAGDLLDTGTITANKFIQFLSYTPQTGGNSYSAYQYDGTDQMALRYSQNGGSDSIAVSSTPPMQTWVGYGDRFIVNYMANFTGEEKLTMISDVTATATGAGTAPVRMESVQKSVQSAQVTRIRISNGAAGSYDTDSNLTVLGSDMTPSAVPATILDGLIFEETDTNKEYIYTASTDTWTEI
jgi:hypothetical protein